MILIFKRFRRRSADEEDVRRKDQPDEESQDNNDNDDRYFSIPNFPPPTSPSRSSKPGEDYIDRYQIVSKIGKGIPSILFLSLKGTFAEVYLVKENNRYYALKKILCKNVKEAQSAIKEVSW